MKALGTELRLALRSLRRAPTFALVAVVTMALGIGANTAVFSVVYSVLVRPLPYADSDQLVWLSNRYLPAGGTGAISVPELWEYRRDLHTVAGLAALATESANLTGLERPLRLQGLQVSANYFDVLGSGPFLGRSFVPEEERPGASPVVLLSHALWQSAFGADPSVLDREILLDGTPRTVVGVMPAEYRNLAAYVFPGQRVDYWEPLIIDPATFSAVSVERHSLFVVGRLVAGADPSAAERDLLPAVRRVEARYPGISNEGSRDVQVLSLHERVTGEIASVLWLLAGAVGLVLLLVCLNVTNLLVARADSRESELAVRAAIGAPRSRLVIHALSESLVIGLAGGVFGIAIAAGTRSALSWLPIDHPALEASGIGLPVLAFSFALSLIAGLAAGALPSARVLGGQVLAGLTAGGARGIANSGRQLLKRGLAVSQVAGAVTLVASAGLLIRSLSELRAVDPGFADENLLMAQINAPRASYGTLEAVRRLYDELESELGALPDVSSVTSSWQTPLQSGMSDWPVMADLGDGQDWVSADPNLVTPGYFEALEIDLVAGRYFDRSDLDRDASPVVLSRSATRALWPDGQAVGRRVNLDFREPVWREVIGVVDDVRGRSLAAEARPQWYVTLADGPFGAIATLTVTVRTTMSAEALRGALADILADIDAEIPVGRVLSMDDQVEATLRAETLLSALLTAFGIVALLLGSLGVYGVMAYSVQTRRRELGLRMVMGARPTGVLGHVVRQGLGLGTVGVLVGLVGAVGAGRLLENLLFGVTPTDASTLATVSVAVLAVVAIATMAPAYRASSVDPIGLLRDG